MPRLPKTTKRHSSQAKERADDPSSLTSGPSRLFKSVWRTLRLPYAKLRDLRRRRSHKSFSRSRRRDYIRQLNIPGYFAFTAGCAKLLFANWKLFLLLAMVYTGLAFLLGGLSSQQTYSTLASTVAEDEVLTGFSQTATLVLSSAGLFSSSLNEVQQVYVGMVVVMTWLVVVWLLREILTGNRPKLRDGLYNAGSPIVSTVIVALLLVVQLIPVGVLALVYGALSSTGLIAQGVGAFLFAGLSALVIVLTLYWVTSTLLALVIVTLPGMYPWAAMRAASDIVVGRRLRVLYRVLWLIGTILLLWVVVMVPVVIIDGWLTQVFDWFDLVPLVPVVAVWLSIVITIWSATYIYILYRKVVESDAAESS